MGPLDGPPRLDQQTTSSTTTRGGGGQRSYYEAKNYKACTDNNGSLTTIRQQTRSATGQAMLVPALLCGVLGPLCWLLGSQGWAFPYALWSSSLIMYAIFGLRERLRRAARFEADRIAFRKRVLQEDETAEWLNIILFRVWQFHEPLLSHKLRQAFLDQLEAVRPSRVLAFEIPLFTLGKKSPFMSSARIITRHALFNSKLPEDRIVLHLTMGFQAPELEVVILARTSYGTYQTHSFSLFIPLFSLAHTHAGTIPVKIKDFYLHGRMRCEMDLVPRYPHVQTASFTFLETPTCDFDIQPMGVSVMEVPYIANLVQQQIVHGINEHLLDPARIVFNLIETQAEAARVEGADGVMFVTLFEVGLPVHRAGSVLNACEYYMKLQLGEDMMFTREVVEMEKKPEVWGLDDSDAGPAATPRINNRFSQALSHLHKDLPLQLLPRPQPMLSFGGETFAFLVGGNVGASDTVQLTLKQKRARTSRTVSTLKVPLEDALDPNAPETGLRTRLEILDGQSGGGYVTLGLRYIRLPEIVLEQTQATVIHRVDERTLSPVNVDSDSLGLLKATDHPHAGSLVIIVHKAEELPAADVHGATEPYAVVFCGEREILRTKKAPTKTLTPDWEASKEFSAYDFRKVQLNVRVFDSDQGYGEKTALAELDLDVRELFAAEEAVNFGRRVTRIHKRYFRMRKPGPVVAEKKEMTAAELKQARKGGADAGEGQGKPTKPYGFLCISILFRPFPSSAVAKDFAFHSSVGNEDEEEDAAVSKAALAASLNAATTAKELASTTNNLKYRKAKKHQQRLSGDAALPHNTPRAFHGGGGGGENPRRRQSNEDPNTDNKEVSSPKTKASFSIARFFRTKRDNDKMAATCTGEETDEGESPVSESTVRPHSTPLHRHHASLAAQP